MSSNFETNLKRGQTGEQIVKKHLQRLGYVIYQPSEGKAHPFDFMCATENKRELFIAEVKTKPSRLYYPDTGIDERHYRDYCHIRDTYNMEVLLFFLDEVKQQIYGNSLTELMRPQRITHAGKSLTYPLHSKGILYFPLLNMQVIANLSDAELFRIKR